MKDRSEQKKRSLTHCSEFLDEIIFDILLVLRITNINYVGFKRMFMLYPGTAGWCSEHFVPYLYSLPFVNSSQKYSITQEIADNISENYRMYLRLKKDNRLAAALRRFNFAYERKLNKDKIIDYFISLEILLGVEGKGKGKQLGQKISNLLGKDEVSKKYFEEKIKASYHLRGEIMHTENQIVIEQLNKTTEFLEGVLREIITRKLIENWNSNDAVS
ncbi:MAG: hypothetical protein K1X85_14105 [Ignavibacteria bacterium]|nr:hypothetical protein [Ignavibacteria bacterium]